MKESSTNVVAADPEQIINSKAMQYFKQNNAGGLKDNSAAFQAASAKQTGSNSKAQTSNKLCAQNSSASPMAPASKKIGT